MTAIDVRIHYATNDGEYRWEAQVDQPRTVIYDGPFTIRDDSDRGLGQKDTDLGICEQLWSAFNRHDGYDEHPALDELKLRSMSVGDVVEIVEPGNGRWYMVASFGFEPIEGIRA